MTTKESDLRTTIGHNMESIGMIEYQKVGMDESAATAVHSVYNKYNQEYADCSLDDIGKPS